MSADSWGGDAWMHSVQWRRLRDDILERDGYRCQIRRPKCTTIATEADHIVPWRDGGARWDPANLRAACGTCNKGRAAVQKMRDGWRRAAARIVLVLGPVGAGKSTYVRENAGPRDVVVDYDTISKAFGPALDRGVEQRHDVTTAARNAVLRKIRQGEVKARRIFIVSSNPDAEVMFPYHEVVIIDPGRDEVLRRCGTERPASFLRLVDDWYTRRGLELGAPSREW